MLRRAFDIRRNFSTRRVFTGLRRTPGVGTMNKYLLIAACVLLASPAAAETVGEKTGINSTLGIAPTTKDFVQEAAVSDMFEIQSSKLASTKLNGSEKAFADQ